MAQLLPYYMSRTVIVQLSKISNTKSWVSLSSQSPLNANTLQRRAQSRATCALVQRAVAKRICTSLHHTFAVGLLSARSFPLPSASNIESSRQNPSSNSIPTSPLRRSPPCACASSRTSLFTLSTSRFLSRTLRSSASHIRPCRRRTL
jgi:hypothetical protein